MIPVGTKIKLPSGEKRAYGSTGLSINQRRENMISGQRKSEYDMRIFTAFFKKGQEVSDGGFLNWLRRTFSIFGNQHGIAIPLAIWVIFAVGGFTMLAHYNPDKPACKPVRVAHEQVQIMEVDPNVPRK